MKTGVTSLPLHYGSAPRWLFERMTRLAREITIAVVSDFGPQGMLERLSDPFWFQALGCVLGFDWHSSGLTTTACGALKEAVRGLEGELGLFIAGGKGKTSRKTPSEIVDFAEKNSFQPEGLVYASKMSAKVDNTALQDGYQLYHHTFVFTGDGSWAVVQQGMNTDSRLARRYHWLSWGVEDFVCEPHQAICSQARGATLNMVAEESAPARDASAALAREKPQAVVGELKRRTELEMPSRHHLLREDINPQHLERILLKSYERKPQGFEEFLAIEGVGPKAIRALALLAELVYGAKASVRDPARFSFAHGGKDGYPYPVDRATYDRSIEFLRGAVARAKMGDRERVDALKRLARLEATLD